MQEKWQNYLNSVLKILNQTQKLPSCGFLAGASIGNLFWQFQSGNEAIINDIDIFLLKNIEDKIEYDKELNYTDNIKLIDTKIDKKIESHIGYSHINSAISSENHIKIISTEYDNKLNYTYYSTYKYDPIGLLKTFDINSTQVGYDLKEHKLYYTENFDKFMKTGLLEVANVNTPSHTAVRIIKKKYELNAKLNMKEEFNLLQLSMNTCMKDFKRIYFSDKYKKMYETYSSDLIDYFKIEKKEYSIGGYLRTYERKINPPNYGVERWKKEFEKLKPEKVEYFKDKIKKIYDFCSKYEIDTKSSKIFDYMSHKTCERFLEEVFGYNHIIYRLIPNCYLSDSFFETNMSSNLFGSEQLVYYYRNIRKDKIKSKIWKSKLGSFWMNDPNYIDEKYFQLKDPDKKEKFYNMLKFVEKMIKIFPNLEKSLDGYDFLTQAKFCKNILKESLENEKMFIFYKFYTGSIDFKNEEEKQFSYNLTKIKYRKEIHIMKENSKKNANSNKNVNNFYYNYIDEVKPRDYKEDIYELEKLRNYFN